MRKATLVLTVIVIVSMTYGCLDNSDIFFGDFDNNGEIDTVFIAHHIGADEMFIFMNGNGLGRSLLFKGLIEVESVLFLNINDDENLDIVFKGVNSDWFVLLGNGDGSMSPKK